MSGVWEPVNDGGWVLSEPTVDHGAIVDAAIAPETKPHDDEKPVKDTPKSGPPTLDEWMDFFSRVVFRTLTDFYVDFVFRGVDEDVITPADLDKLKMTREERREISVPLASFANKSKIARKHGRSVIAFADSLDALIMLGMWVARVNKVAKRYQPTKLAKQRRNQHVSEPATAANGNGAGEPIGPTTIFNPGNG